MSSSSLRILCCLALCFVGACSGAPDSSKQRASEKIYNGEEIPREIAPQIVQLAVYLSDGREISCTGTVIGASAVVTATHCFLEAGIIAAGVRVLGIEHPITELTPAPNFQAGDVAIFNDVVIAKTAEPLGVPALPILASVPVTAQQGLGIYGYGLDEDGIPGILRSGVIEPDIVTPNHIIDAVEGGQNTCMGDSGGPLIAFFQSDDGRVGAGLVGITSSGDGGGCTDEETAYYINLQNPELLQFIVQQVPEVGLL